MQTRLLLPYTQDDKRFKDYFFNGTLLTAVTIPMPIEAHPSGRIQSHGNNFTDRRNAETTHTTSYLPRSPV